MSLSALAWFSSNPRGVSVRGDTEWEAVHVRNLAKHEHRGWWVPRVSIGAFPPCPCLLKRLGIIGTSARDRSQRRSGRIKKSEGERLNYAEHGSSMEEDDEEDGEGEQEGDTEEDGEKEDETEGSYEVIRISPGLVLGDAPCPVSRFVS